MRYIPYPALLSQEYYILSILCGFFTLKEPLYTTILACFLLFYAFRSGIRIAFCSLCCLLCGIMISIVLYKPMDTPEWYSSGGVYSIRADVENVSFDSEKKIQVTLSNIVPLYTVDIQNISKKKPCIVEENEVVLYTKARSCGVGYPTSGESLPHYAIYTITRDIPNIQAGQTIEGVFTIEDIRSNENGGFSLKEYYNNQHIYYRLRLKEINTRKIYAEAHWIKQYTEYANKSFSDVVETLYPRNAEGKQNINSIQKDSLAIAYALLLGNRFYFNTALEEVLLTAGLLHSVVLSGLHVSSLIIFALPLLFLVYRIAPSLIISIPMRYVMLVFIVVLGVLYGVISSFPISYMRAIIMVCIMFLLTYTHRKYTLLDVLLYTLFVIFILTPEALYTVSLQLSAGAVFAIYCALPFAKRYITIVENLHIPFYIKYILQTIGSIIITTSAINLVLLPFLLSTFGTIPHIVFLNLLWLPVLSCIVLPFLLISFLFALCGYIEPVLWNLALFPIEMLITMLYHLNTYDWFDVFIQMRPHPFTSISFYLALFSLLLLFNRRTSKKILYALCIASILFLMIPIGLRIYKHIDDTLSIEVFDVGKGQSILIEHKGKRMLVDVAERTPYFDAGRKILSPLLTFNAFPSLEYIILTHQDSDHIGGAIFLSQYYSIKTLYHNGDTTKESKTVAELFSNIQDTKVEALQEGDVVRLTKDVSFQVLLPNKVKRKTQKKNDESNANSIVGMITYKGKNIALLLGDIDISGQEYLVERYNTDLQCEAIILPHHGSQHNMYIPLYETTKTSYAIASTAAVNTNFVNPKLQNALKDNAIRLYTTYHNGKITMRIQRNHTRISYEK